MIAACRNAIFRHLPQRGLIALFCQRHLQLLLQDAQHALIDKIVHQARLMKTHFMFGRVDVHIHLMRIYLQVQHKSRLLIGPQFVFTGLTNRVINQAIAHHPPIDVAILNLRQRRIGMQRIGHPAA